MSHRNAILAPKGRLRLAKCVVDDLWTLRRAAERFQVSVPTAQRWAERYREHGEEGMYDRSSRPRRSPRRVPTRRERRVIAVGGVRWTVEVGFLESGIEEPVRSVTCLLQEMKRLSLIRRPLTSRPKAGDRVLRGLLPGS